MSYVVINPEHQLSFEDQLAAGAGAFKGRMSKGQVAAEILRLEAKAAGVPRYEYAKWKGYGMGPGHGREKDAFFDGTSWTTKRAHRAKSKAGRRKKRPAARRKGAARRRPRLGRDARGRYLPRKRKRPAARRAAPRRRAAARRTRRGRDARGRFLKKRHGRRTRARRLPRITRAHLRAARRPRKGVRKHMRARRTIRAGQRISGLIRVNPRTGAVIMPRVLVANPRRRRKNPRRARARNPMGSIVQTAKSVVMPMAAGAAAGGLAGFIDAKFLSTKPTTSIAAKLGLAFLGAFALRKKHPAIAMGFAGGMVGATGYGVGVKLGGGHVALNGLQGLKGLADMAADDPEVADLIAGLGDVVPDNMGDAAGEYNDALGDDGDQGGTMGDVVED